MPRLRLSTSPIESPAAFSALAKVEWRTVPERYATFLPFRSSIFRIGESGFTTICVSLERFQLERPISFTSAPVAARRSDGLLPI
ncbi:hypothetical protein ACVINY_000279 [Sinorhizobium meliloti]